MPAKLNYQEQIFGESMALVAGVTGFTNVQYQLKSKTHAMTPDKIDRSSRSNGEGKEITIRNISPYPLTEEEATPEVPRSEEIVFF